MARIFHRSGAEGPRHDPYHFDEWHFVRTDGRSVRLHLGLADWIEIDGGRLPEGSTDCIGAFEGFIGIPFAQFVRATGRLSNPRGCPTCGVKGKLRWERGFPGEHMLVCGACGNVAADRFDRSEIE